MDESQSDGGITRNAPRVSPVRRGARLLRTVRGGRDWAGWLLVAVGAVLCVLGWYGVSGERFVEQQVPYLASSTVPGAALIVAGAVLVALRPPPAREELTDRRVERLYDLLVEPEPSPGPGSGPEPGPGPDVPPVDRPGQLAVPEGTRYHRPDCPLVTGKATAAPVDAAAVRQRGLTPCPLCSPDAPGGPHAPDSPGGPDASGSPTRPGEAAPPSG